MSHDEINRQAFREEAYDLLSELETALLELEENPEDRDLVDRVFRAMHTIKGSGAMFGFDDIAAFTHEVETVMDLVRNGLLQIDKTLIDLSFASRDRIQDMLDNSESGSDPDPARTTELIDRLRRFIPASDEIGPDEDFETGTEIDEQTRNLFRIRFKPAQDIFLTGSKPINLVEEIREMGQCRAVAHAGAIPDLAELEPESCHVWWDLILATSQDIQAIHDVFIFVEDDSEITIQNLDDEGGLDSGEYKLLGEILVERGDITQDLLDQALAGQQPLGRILESSGVVTSSQIESALHEQSVVREARKGRKDQKEIVEASSSIRVAADKLDDLVNLVGELVIVQAQITQMAEQRTDPTLTALSEELERLSDDLRDSTLGIRMLPIGTTFSKFRRLVRDLSDDLDKQIELRTLGGETELDKTVIERLSDPLVHLLRNSIDHGIESPDQRRAQGKPETGTITLAAEHSGGEVLIRIHDDGRGLDPAAIKNKAVERGLISPEAELSDKEAYNLIFHSGFSTAKTVTNVSGRGVGMDVVKQSIDSLRGSVDIDSTVGQGSTITVRLPLTLAIIDGLQVQVGNEFFVVPLLLVEECIELIAAQKKTDDRMVNLRGEIVPYIKIREWFEVPGTPPEIEQIVVTSGNSGRVGLVVDKVIGEHQTVIKSLGKVYQNVEGLSGATIKGDGSMALILDVPRLIRSVAES
jgi:two-component system chemotaxis sensor kinase CheA